MLYAILLGKFENNVHIFFSLLFRKRQKRPGIPLFSRTKKNEKYRNSLTFDAKFQNSINIHKI